MDLVEHEIEFNGLCYIGMFPSDVKPDEAKSLEQWMKMATEVYLFL